MRGDTSRGPLLGLLLPPTAWLAAFVLVPAAVVAAQAFSGEGLRQFNADTARLLGKSLLIAAEVTLVCLLAGYPVAWFIAGCSPGWRSALLLLVILPFWTSVIVRTYALIFLLRPIGWYLTIPGVVAGLAHSYLPFMILPLYVSIEKVPKRLLEAAQDLGASPWRAFWSVTVPLTMPGIAAGCLLVFVPVLGSFATPELLGGSRAVMYGSQISFHFTTGQNPAAGSALTLVLTGLTVALTWLYARLRKSEGLV
jgi:spermidine/putrescine transport system permease protein